MSSEKNKESPVRQGVIFIAEGSASPARRRALDHRLGSPPKQQLQTSPSAVERLRNAEKRREQIISEKVETLSRHHDDVRDKVKQVKAETAQQQARLQSNLVSRVQEASERRDRRLQKMAREAGKAVCDAKQRRILVDERTRDARRALARRIEQSQAHAESNRLELQAQRLSRNHTVSQRVQQRKQQLEGEQRKLVDKMSKGLKRRLSNAGHRREGFLHEVSEQASDSYQHFFTRMSPQANASSALATAVAMQPSPTKDELHTMPKINIGDTERKASNEDCNLTFSREKIGEISKAVEPNSRRSSLLAEELGTSQETLPPISQEILPPKIDLVCPPPIPVKIIHEDEIAGSMSHPAMLIQRYWRKNAKYRRWKRKLLMKIPMKNSNSEEQEEPQIPITWFIQWVKKLGALPFDECAQELQSENGRENTKLMLGSIPRTIALSRIDPRLRSTRVFLSAVLITLHPEIALGNSGEAKDSGTEKNDTISVNLHEAAKKMMKMVHSLNDVCYEKPAKLCRVQKIAECIRRFNLSRRAFMIAFVPWRSRDIPKLLGNCAHMYMNLLAAQAETYSPKLSPALRSEAVSQSVETVQISQSEAVMAEITRQKQMVMEQVVRLIGPSKAAEWELRLQAATAPYFAQYARSPGALLEKRQMQSEASSSSVPPSNLDIVNLNAVRVSRAAANSASKSANSIRALSAAWRGETVSPSSSPSSSVGSTGGNWATMDARNEASMKTLTSTSPKAGTKLPPRSMHDKAERFRGINVSNLDTESPAAKEPTGLLKNEQLAHELILNPSYQLPIPEIPENCLLPESTVFTSTSKTCANEKEPLDLESRFKKAMERAYWDKLKNDVQNGNFDLLMKMLIELHGSLRSLVSGKSQASQKLAREMENSIDSEWLKQNLKQGVFSIETLRKLLQFLVSIILKLEAPVHNEATTAWLSAIEKRLTNSANTKPKKPDETVVDIDEMTVKDLRNIVSKSGLSSEDCVSKSELRDRAREAFKVIKNGDGKGPSVSAVIPDGVVDILPPMFIYLRCKVDQIRVGISNFHLQMLGTYLQTNSEGIKFERQRFKARLHVKPHSDASTKRWIKQSVAAYLLKHPKTSVTKLFSGPEGSNTTLDCLRSGVVDLIKAPEILRLTDSEHIAECPDTFWLDISRLVGLQNKLQAISLQGTFSAILMQSLMRCNVPKHAALEAGTQMSARLDVVLNNASTGGGVQLRHLEAEVLQTVRACLVKYTGKELSETEANLLKGLVNKATSLEHPIYKMLMKRTANAIKFWLKLHWNDRLNPNSSSDTNNRNNNDSNIPELAPNGLMRSSGSSSSDPNSIAFNAHITKSGLTSISRGIIDISKEILPLLRHNILVHGERYNKHMRSTILEISNTEADKILQNDEEDSTSSENEYSDDEEI